MVCPVRVPGRFWFRFALDTRMILAMSVACGCGDVRYMPAAGHLLLMEYGWMMDISSAVDAAGS